VTTACDVRFNSRLRNSCSNPFITESTTISAATPTATPSKETIEMNDTKRLARRARKYRRPMQSVRGRNMARH